MTAGDTGAGDGGGEAGPYAARLAQLRGRLATLVEGIDELVLDILQDAVAEGRTARPELERRLSRARNGLERAARLLGDPGDPGEEAANA